MAGLKKKKKEASKKNPSEGDLFPRGAAPSATPRVRKRDGQVLFAPSSKRARPTRPSIDDGHENVDLSAEIRVTRHGAALSPSRLSPGMTLLALVVRADHQAVHVVLPSGINASADPDEILVQPELAPTSFVKRQESGASDDDSDAETDGSSDSSDEDDGICPLWQTVHVGQVVRVALLSVEQNDRGRRAVRVSFKPDLVNVGLNPAHVLRKGFPAYAAVRSVEDHGYVLSFGSHVPTTGFLPFDKGPHDEDGDTDEVVKLTTGHPIEVVIEHDVVVPKKKAGKKFAGVAQVSATRDKVLAATINVPEQLNYHELRAGMLLPAKVIKEGPGGVALNAFGVFKIAVDASHVPRLADGSWDVKVGQQVMSRILYVDASQKRIGASLLESFVAKLAPRSVPVKWKIGTVMKRLKVEQVKPGFGLIMSWMPHDEKETNSSDVDKMHDDDDAAEPDEDHTERQVPVFAHISRVSDTKGVKLESNYHRDMIVNRGARIVSVSRFDGMVNVDLRPSILARKALSIEEIEIGSLYDCRVMSHTTLGSVSVAVDGDVHLPGIVPSIHVSDVPIFQKRLAQHENLRIGATLRCRALFVNSQKGKVFLSAKKSIVSPKYPLLTSLDQASDVLRRSTSQAPDIATGAGLSGTVFTGSVSKVLENGNVVISFCGQLAGLVPRSELCLTTPGESAVTQSEVENLYPIGQTVNVRPTRVDTKLRRLWLSMNLQAGNRFRKHMQLRIGQFVDGHVKKVDDDAKHFVVAVSVETGIKREHEMNTEDSGEGKNGGITTIDCHLPFGHLSDTQGMTERLVRHISKAANTARSASPISRVELQKMLVLSVREQTPVLTLKQSLRTAFECGKLPRNFSEVVSLTERAKEQGECRPVLNGYVKALLPSGVIIGFLGEAVGFARKSRIADHFVSDPARSLHINQSVPAVVDSIDEDHQRFLLSLRLSDVGNNGIASQTLSLFQSLKTWEAVMQKANIEEIFSVGSITDAEVGTKHAYGVTYKLKSGKNEAVGVALDANESSIIEDVTAETSSLGDILKSATPKSRKKRGSRNEADGEKKGEMERVRILDADPFTGVIDVSRDEKVIGGGMKKSILNVGSTFNATVLLVKSSYIILAVARSKTRSAIAFALGPTVSDNLVIRPGTSVHCTVLDKSQAQTSRNLVLIDWQSFRTNVLTKADNTVKDVDQSDCSTTISLLRDSGGQDETLVVGKTVAGKVTRVFSLHVFVGIAKGVVGQIHVTNVGELQDEEKAKLWLGPVPTDIANRFRLPELGSKVRPAFIAGVKPSAEGQDSSPVIVELALAEHRPYLGDVSTGQKFLGFIKNVSSRFARSGDANETERSFSYTRVAIGPSTVVTCTDVNCLFADEAVSLKVGSPVMCLITDVQKGDNSRIWGALSENGRQSTDFFVGIVRNVDPGHGLKVEIPWHARDADSKGESWGTVALCDVADDFDDVSAVIAAIKKGDRINVRKLDLAKGTSDEHVSTWLSMRDRADGDKSVLTSESARSLKPGAKVRGFVSGINEKGCFVSIGRGVTAHVLLCDLADNFVKQPEKEFPAGKVVEGAVAENKRSASGSRISMVLRKRPRKSLKEAPKTGDLKEGTRVTGVVKRVEAYGALVEVSKGVSGLLHKSEADQDRFIENPAEEWVVGQKLTAVVVKVDGKGVKLGTKRCYFEAAGLTETEIDDVFSSHEVSKSALRNTTTDQVTAGVEFEDEKQGSEQEESDEGDDDVVMLDPGAVSEDDSGGEMEGSDRSEGESDDDPEVPPLSIGQGFNFGGSASAGMSDGATFEEQKDKEEANINPSSPTLESGKRKSRDKREKKRQKEATEKAIRLREEALAKNPDAPETAADFERLLVGEPNNSVLWIRCMAFCLSLRQVDKARSTAERALEAISLSEESERTNVWVAYLNLEAQYGASNSVAAAAVDKLGYQQDAAVFRVFDRACERVTDVESFHLQAASALRSTSSRIADEILRRATRKFKKSKDVWIASGQVQFKSGDKKAGRRTLDKALASIEKRDHIAVISKFAQFEYKYGTAERGRTVFESLVGNFPKRLDLWNIYLDMQMGQCRAAEEDDKQQAVEATRNLFEKCTTLDLSSKKMKFVFQKWLSFEKRFGTKAQRNEVKNKAREYVERIVSAKE